MQISPVATAVPSSDDSSLSSDAPLPGELDGEGSDSDVSSLQSEDEQGSEAAKDEAQSSQSSDSEQPVEVGPGSAHELAEASSDSDAFDTDVLDTVQLQDRKQSRKVCLLVCLVAARDRSAVQPASSAGRTRCKSSMILRQCNECTPEAGTRACRVQVRAHRVLQISSSLRLKGQHTVHKHSQTCSCPGHYCAHAQRWATSIPLQFKCAFVLTHLH